MKIDADGDGKEVGKKYGVSGFPSTPVCHFLHLVRHVDVAHDGSS